MVVYLDLIFILNSLADALALYVTARLSGLTLRCIRLMSASLLGGAYGVLCLIPQLDLLGCFPFQMLTVLLLVRLVFGAQKTFLRLTILFFFLSCTIGGAMMAVSQYIYDNGIFNTLQNIDWKVFFLVSGMCYFLLSFIFCGSAKHAVAGEFYRAVVTHGDRKVTLDVLYDTGHTLTDPYTGTPVLTAWCKALEPLWSEEEQSILDRLETLGSLRCAEELSAVSPGKFRLIPYRAVGVSNAVLLAFQADRMILNGEDLGTLTVTLSPTPVSDGGGYTALWGGERKEKTENAASTEIFTAPSAATVGLDPPR